MAKLTVKRPRQFADLIRKYDIVVDGDRLAAIRYGQTVELEIPPGLHQIIATIDWFRSNPIEIEARPEDCICLEVGSNVTGLRRWHALEYITLWRDRYLCLRKV